MSEAVVMELAANSPETPRFFSTSAAKTYGLINTTASTTRRTTLSNQFSVRWHRRRRGQEYKAGQDTKQKKFIHLQKEARKQVFLVCITSRR